MATIRSEGPRELTAYERRLLDAIAARAAQLANRESTWLQGLRQAGQRVFSDQGLPNRRVEAWKYSDLRHAVERAETTEARAAPVVAREAAHDATAICMDDGVLKALPKGLDPSVEVLGLADALAAPSAWLSAHMGRVFPQADHPVIGLNAALMEDGVVIRIAPGAVLSEPLRLRYRWSGKARRDADGRHLRVLVVVEAGAEATLIESHEGPGGGEPLVTLVSELGIAPGAKLNHARLEVLGGAACHAAVTLGDIGQAARYDGFYLSEGSGFARHEAFLRFSGEKAEAHINGAYLLAGARHCDNTIVIDHAVPNCTSRQMFRGVLTGSARGVFQGRIIVEPGAQHTDAHQLNRALLLSEHAEINAKPELEIFADDVKCSHGATAGQLDERALFYLRARGIPETEARLMLVEAFVTAALEEIAIPELRQLCDQAVQDWLKTQREEVSHGV